MTERSDRYAREVLRAGRDLGVTPRGIVIGLATCLVESGPMPGTPPDPILMYANRKVPESLTLPHDAVGSDGMSCGLFQQQLRQGPTGEWWWGPLDVIMDPYASARLFFERLAKRNYTTGDAGAHAQAVQGSAFPDRYGQRMSEAQRLYDRIAGDPTQPQEVHTVGDPVWLADVLRAEGLVCDIFPGAFERGHGDFGQIWGIVAHHTGASGSPGPGPIANHPSLGLASQLHLDRAGKYTLCGVGIAWHAGQGSWPGIARDNANQVTIGIEAENNGTEGWSDAQYRAYVRGCGAILRKLGHDASHVIGHKEWAGPAQGKWDPGGIDMDAFRRDVQAVINGEPPKGKEDDMSWGEIIKNKAGQDVSREDMVKWIDANVNEVLKQLGPWAQLGTNEKGEPLTLVDAVAQHGRDLGEIKTLLAELAGKKA